MCPQRVGLSNQKTLLNSLHQKVLLISTFRITAILRNSIIGKELIRHCSQYLPLPGLSLLRNPKFMIKYTVGAAADKV